MSSLASRIILGTLIASSLAPAAMAGPTYQDGRVVDFTVAGAEVLIRLDTGVPDNCTGTPYGWMSIPATGKTMQAYIIGMQLRGDLGEVQMRVFASGLVNGYCNVNQIDPT